VGGRLGVRVRDGEVPELVVRAERRPLLQGEAASVVHVRSERRWVRPPPSPRRTHDHSLLLCSWHAPLWRCCPCCLGVAGLRTITLSVPQRFPDGRRPAPHSVCNLVSWNSDLDAPYQYFSSDPKVVECRTLASALHRAPPLPRAGDFPRGCAVALQSLSENHAETLLEKRALWVDEKRRTLG
jgi:hypothetical protein